MRIAIFGDSISEGIGSRKINYVSKLKEILSLNYDNIEIINYAHTGTTIKYINNIKELWENEYFDVCIIAYGNVDGMLRPNLNSLLNLYSILPKRYKQNGMLNPRPYYSNTWYKSFFQHLDSFFRWHLNAFLLKLQGSTTIISLKEFEETYIITLDMLSNISSNMILLSTVKVSDRFFPKTNLSFVEFNRKIKSIAKLYEDHYVNIYGLLDKYDYYDDFFHPNSMGYNIIADAIASEIRKIFN